MTENQLTASCHEHLLKRLRDLEYATGYLNAVLEKRDEAAFQLALRNGAEAQLRPLPKTPLQWS